MAITGTVQWFGASKGFGFLANEDGGDVFIYISEIEGEGYRTSAEGNNVKFEVTKPSRARRQPT